MHTIDKRIDWFVCARTTQRGEALEEDALHNTSQKVFGGEETNLGTTVVHRSVEVTRADMPLNLPHALYFHSFTHKYRCIMIIFFEAKA